MRSSYLKQRKDDATWRKVDMFVPHGGQWTGPIWVGYCGQFD